MKILSYVTHLPKVFSMRQEEKTDFPTWPWFKWEWFLERTGHMMMTIIGEQVVLYATVDECEDVLHENATFTHRWPNIWFESRIAWSHCCASTFPYCSLKSTYLRNQLITCWTWPRSILCWSSKCKLIKLKWHTSVEKSCYLYSYMNGERTSKIVEIAIWTCD